MHSIEYINYLSNIHQEKKVGYDLFYHSNVCVLLK